MLKLNLGCGFDKRDGYVNIDFQDFHEPDVVADVRSLDQYLDATCDEIIAQDVLEHLERSEVAPALAEWARLLVEDGRLVLRVPDVLGVARLLAADADVERHDILLQNLFGTQAYSGDYHHAGFTELTLRSRLHDAGFVVETLEHRDEWLFDVVAVRRANPGPFDPGSLQYVRFGPDEATDEDVGAGLVGRVDRLAASVAERAPRTHSAPRSADLAAASSPTDSAGRPPPAAISRSAQNVRDYVAAIGREARFAARSLAGINANVT